LRAAYSTEDDYKSVAGGLTIRHATPDQNTTYMIGGGYSSDQVFPQGIGVQQTYYKRTYDAIVGLTQLSPPNDTAHFNFYYAHQSGSLTAPYKAYWGVDQRHEKRDQFAGLIRW